MMKQSLFPWLIAGAMAAYVFVLNYHVEHRQPPEPGYAFYDTTQVQVELVGLAGPHEVYGEFNNVIEGQKQLVKAVALDSGRYQLNFTVNSPRPARLYLEAQSVDIFLVPGDSSLKLFARFDSSGYELDSLGFAGELAPVCQYYRLKDQQFDHVRRRGARHTLPAGNLMAYAAKQDSLAARELAFLAEQEIFATLPDWFVHFERNEILYHKAYLKLTQLTEAEAPGSYLDRVPVNNEAAVFCYYYYLFLQAHISRLDTMALPVDLGQVATDRYAVQREAAIGSRILEGEPHDVFLTRLLFQLLQKGELELASQLLRQYEPNFYSRRYFRFLKAQLKGRREAGV